MWQYVTSGMHYMAHLKREEWAVVLVIVMLLGWFCMRGFGSRSDY